MPHIKLSLYKGRTPEVKEQIAKALQKALVEEMGNSYEAVSVEVEDVEQADWSNWVAANVEKDELLIPSDFVNETMLK